MYALQQCCADEDAAKRRCLKQHLYGVKVDQALPLASGQQCQGHQGWVEGHWRTTRVPLVIVVPPTCAGLSRICRSPYTSVTQSLLLYICKAAW